jgi:hypothetical protein
MTEGEAIEWVMVGSSQSGGPGVVDLDLAVGLADLDVR